MTDYSLLRVLFWLPLIFLLSWLVAGTLLSFIAWAWPYFFGGAALFLLVARIVQ